MSDWSPFPSACPGCNQDRLQHGYTREQLLELLKTGAAIDAGCAYCGMHWHISPEERTHLRQLLAFPNKCPIMGMCYSCGGDRPDGGHPLRIV